MYDVTIIGAGVVGAMTARELSRYSLRICIVDRENDVASGSTKANSAIVHAGFDAKEGTLKAKLNVAGSQMMEGICHDLGVSYRRNGSLVLGFNKDDQEILQRLLENGRKNGVQELRLIDTEELRRLEPNISDEAICALYAPTGAIVCPYELTVAAVGNAMDNGADLKLNFEVSQIEETVNGYIIRSVAGDAIETHNIVNAAGLFSDEVAKMISDNSFTVHPRRGEYLLLDKECGNTVSHTVFTVPTKMGKGILVSPTVDKNLLLGPTSVDSVDKNNKNTTSEGIDLIITETARSVKNINTRMVITSFCGLRAVGDTGDFIINMPKKGFVNAAGIESPGLSASPAIAAYIAKLLKDSGVALEEKSDYIKTRETFRHFNLLSVEEKNAIIAKDPSFGNIICRCETISEGEILHAIRTNPKPRDLDGVKRRTRAQMGRCQGGFCSPYIMKLLSEELGIPLEEVTKNGGASKVVLGETKEAETYAQG